MCSRNLQYIEIQQGGGVSKGDREGIASEVGGRPGGFGIKEVKTVFKDFKNKVSHNVRPLDLVMVPLTRAVSVGAMQTETELE